MPVWLLYTQQTPKCGAPGKPAMGEARGPHGARAEPVPSRVAAGRKVGGCVSVQMCRPEAVPAQATP